MIGKAKVLKKKNTMETVTVNVGSDDGNVSGYEVTITTSDGEVVAVQTTATGTYKIPFGCSYTIQASDVSGYITPSAQTFVASDSKRVVDVTYVYNPITTNPTNGIYIQDTDGYCYPVDLWDDSKTPNGVAVVTDNCRFVMALTDANNGVYVKWCGSGGIGITVNGIVTTTDRATAMKDYKGDTNTTTILSRLGNSASSAPAAYYCRSFTFPNGQKGYLGAAGECQAVLDNMDTVKSAFNKLGLDSPAWFWTSTQSNANDSWMSYMGSKGLSYFSKDDKFQAWAFTSL